MKISGFYHLFYEELVVLSKYWNVKQIPTSFLMVSFAWLATSVTICRATEKYDSILFTKPTSYGVCRTAALLLCIANKRYATICNLKVIKTMSVHAYVKPLPLIIHFFVTFMQIKNACYFECVSCQEISQAGASGSLAATVCTVGFAAQVSACSASVPSYNSEGSSTETINTMYTIIQA